MKKIVLMCANGMSTGVLMNRMKAAASALNYDCEIEAHPTSEAADYADRADIILLGPQVRFDKEEVMKKCPNVPVEVIDMSAYGRMDGEAVIKHVQGVLRDK